MPITKLFDTNRKNTHLGLQKDACASEYRKFQTKIEINYQTGKNIASTNKDLETFYKNWIKNFQF